ncbi:hypothetical protein CHELA20_50321 [Hyphomicrobiales bacterium]|nr:hypothetical protein CHELA41_20053 [Hyphomicrobiales bacterium]CAH1668225.1 hypothetical protein CHELA20_50321 [Hyphomicrobiales bacterium]
MPTKNARQPSLPRIMLITSIRIVALTLDIFQRQTTHSYATGARVPCWLRKLLMTPRLSRCWS